MYTSKFECAKCIQMIQIVVVYCLYVVDWFDVVWCIAFERWLITGVVNIIRYFYMYEDREFWWLLVMQVVVASWFGVCDVFSLSVCDHH